ncbi:MAG: Cys-Gln thioester bond-forming surface protein [Bacilli bacterium]|nr:Cys-Gln thioester bond-forming surface protein [Bacilli bacterium]
MKKKIFFLITIMAILLGVKKVQAESFYEAEFINGIYMNKYQYSNNTIYYQQARMFRNSATGELVYCIEPLTFFKENSSYTITNSPRNLSSDQLTRIKKIAHFGYQYKGHNDTTWYAVTQIMIWRESNPYGGDYYFTETLNGQRTNKYDSYIEEINQLIREYDKNLPIHNQTYTLVQGEEKEIEVGNSLNDYSSNNDEIKIESGKVLIKPLEEGDYSISLTKNKERSFGKDFTIYQAVDSQTLMTLGDLDSKKAQFQIHVISNSIKVIKIDEDTKKSIPQGEATLDGAIFQLLDSKEQEIEQIEISEGIGEIKNIPLGTYYLKEIKAGTGYTINDTIYEINLSEENPNAEITVSNKVIEKEIVLQKKYGEEENLHPEENISFDIINNQNEIIDSVITNEEGIVTFLLPYGSYTIKQTNTTEGYELLKPFLLIVHNSEKEILELKDYKIPVPNTSTKDKINIWKYILLIFLLFC